LRLAVLLRGLCVDFASFAVKTLNRKRQEGPHKERQEPQTALPPLTREFPGSSRVSLTMLTKVFPATNLLAEDPV
jgi:hypothetical protein